MVNYRFFDFIAYGIEPFSLPKPYAPVVQWIEYEIPDLVIEVRFLSGAPVRILQAISVRLASLGDYFIRDFRGKTELAIF